MIFSPMWLSNIKSSGSFTAKLKQKKKKLINNRIKVFEKKNYLMLQNKFFKKTK